MRHTVRSRIINRNRMHIKTTAMLLTLLIVMIFTACTATPATPPQPMPPVTAACGIENCHGMDITCGPNPAEMCDMMYALGDKCRQYAQCSVVNGACTQVSNPAFDTCKSCVERCQQQFTDDQMGLWECEGKCD